MKISKKWLLIAALVLSIAMATSGTVAYLQDTDEDVNVMVLGNVDIEQHEMQRAEGVAYNATAKEGDLVPFVNGQALYPAYEIQNGGYTAEKEEDGCFKWGPYVHTGTAWNGLWNENKLAGAMDKFVFVENTGKSPAYFRTWIALECPEGMEYSEGPDKEFMNNVNGSKLYNWTDGGYVTIGGVRYAVMCATYQDALLPGEWSHPSLLQVVMTHNATNEDMKLLDGSYEILVKTQAVQVTNFETAGAEVALNAAFGTEHPWTKSAGIVYVDGGKEDGLTADEKKAILDALKSGTTIVTEPATELLIDIDSTNNVINAMGAEVVLSGYGTAAGESYDYGYFGFIPTTGEGVSVSNLNVSGRGFVELGHHQTSTGGNYVANKLVIKDLVATLCINNCGNNIAGAFSHYGTATLNDCVMTGTTAVKEGYKPYDAAFVNGTKTTINGGEYGTIYLANQAHVYVDALVDTIDSYAISYKNLGKLTIGTHAEVGTINLYDTGSYKPQLVIEGDAKVGKIIYNGTIYSAKNWVNP